MEKLINSGVNLVQTLCNDEIIFDSCDVNVWVSLAIILLIFWLDLLACFHLRPASIKPFESTS